MFGQRDYSMRIWLDPDKLAIRNMTAGDVVAALCASRTFRSPPGRSASRRRCKGQQTQITLTTLGRLVKITEQFEKIIVKTTPDGRMCASATSAMSSWGPRTRTSTARSTASPVANLAIFQLPDANALETADIVKAKIEELKKDFPEASTT